MPPGNLPAEFQSNAILGEPCARRTLSNSCCEDNGTWSNPLHQLSVTTGGCLLSLLRGWWRLNWTRQSCTILELRSFPTVPRSFATVFCALRWAACLFRATKTCTTAATAGCKRLPFEKLLLFSTHSRNACASRLAKAFPLRGDFESFHSTFAQRPLIHSLRSLRDVHQEIPIIFTNLLRAQDIEFAVAEFRYIALQHLCILGDPPFR